MNLFVAGRRWIGFKASEVEPGFRSLEGKTPEVKFGLWNQELERLPVALAALRGNLNDLSNIYFRSAERRRRV